MKKIRQFLSYLAALPTFLSLIAIALVGFATTASAMKMRYDIGGGEDSGPSGNLHLFHDNIYFDYALKLHIGTLLGEPVTSTEMLWQIDPFGSTVSVPSLGGATPGLVLVPLGDLGPEAVSKIGFTEFKVVFRFSSSAFGQDVVLVQDVGVLADGDGQEWSFNVPGSPDWSQLYSPYRTEHHANTNWTDHRIYLSEEEAREVMRSEPTLLDAWIIPGNFTSYKLHQWYRKTTSRTRFNAMEQFADEVRNKVEDLGLVLNLTWSGWSFAHLLEVGSNAEIEARRATGIGVIFEQGGRDQNYWRIASESLFTELADNLLALKTVDFHSSADYEAFLQVNFVAKHQYDERIARAEAWTSPDPDPSQFAAGFAAQFDDTPLQNPVAVPATVTAQSSILFLIDTSGSMAGAKIEAAKEAALENMRASIKSGSEVAILGFSGDCTSPVSFSHPFSMDAMSLENLISEIGASGGTPLATALAHANQFLHDNKAPSSLSQAIVLLADGNDSCGNVDNVLDDLSRRNILYRHEAVGLGIDSGSQAVQQLNAIADRTAGGYHNASDPKHLRRAFKDAFENMAIARMLGQFGSGVRSSTASKPSSLWDQLK